MKQPLCALFIAPDSKMRQAILDETKKISIREGHRDYPVGGKIMLCCHLEPWAVMADIVSVRHINLWQVTEEEWLSDGFESQALMLSGLRKFYPNITRSSPVTVIRWNNVSGTLVEEVERIKALDGKNAKTTCDKCDKPAVWVRKTQFSGSHFFCDADAKTEKDFGQEDPSYFYWKKLK